MSEVQTQEVKPTLTREQKLVARLDVLRKRVEDATAEYTEVQAELQSITALAAVDAGYAVVVKIGRKFADKDTTRYVDGVVLAVRTDEGTGAKQYKVQYGEGFDADVTVVSASSISLLQVPAAE